MEDASTSKSEDLEILTEIQRYEQEFVKSISTIVKNVSEYFALVHDDGGENGTGTGTVAVALVQGPVSPNTTSAPPPLFYQKSFLNNISNNNNSGSDGLRAGSPFINATLLQPEPSSSSDDINDSYWLTSWSDFAWSELSVQFLLIASLIFGLWLVNRQLLKSRTLTTFTEVLLSWILILAGSPILILLCVPIFIARAAVNYYLTLNVPSGQKPKIFLANPFEAVWSYEAPNSASTCVGFYIVQGEANLSKIREVLLRRGVERVVNGVEVNSCFRCVLKTVFGFIAWERQDQFDIRNHINYFHERTSTPEKKDPDLYWTETDLFEEFELLHETSLCDLQPNPESELSKVPGVKLSPWEVLVVPKLAYANGDPGNSYYGLLFRVHHSLMDGISMGHILHDCIADQPFKFSLDPTAPLRIPKLKLLFGHFLSVICTPRITLRNVFLRESNSFHGKSLTGPKKFGWSRPLRMEALKQLKNETKTSVFSVLLCCIAGSIKKLYTKRYGPKAVPKLIHACPPIAILPYPDRYPKNRFSVVLYPVHLAAKTTLDRLNQIFRESKSLAVSPEIMANYYVVYVLGSLPDFLMRILSPLAHATFTFSNIPGPAESIKIFGGDKVVEIGSWIPVKNRIGVAMGLFSYEDRLRVTFIGDKACLAEDDDIPFLVNEFENEINELTMNLELKCDNPFIE